ncbi:MAG TPA: stage II sporulation protein M [Gemmatimonadaceae bacterium]|nr:stage II sporulation protein M [Gemmatimonadaceae bacterium]
MSSTLTQTVDIETPELVTFSYTIAGIGSRVAAALIDYFLCLLLLILMFVGFATLGVGRFIGREGTSSDAWALALVMLVQFFVIWGYYVLWEGLADGQTPGKRYMRLRVVSDGGYSVTFAASAVRNLVRVIDMQPVITYGVGITSIVATKQGKRLGDLAAGTLVVREELLRWQPGVGNRAGARQSRAGGIGNRGPWEPGTAPANDGAASGAEPAVVPHARLSDDEYAVLERFIERRNSIDRARRDELAARLAERFAVALGGLPSSEGRLGDRLFELYADERQARSRGAVVGRETGAARERHAIVASGTPRWSSFATRLDRAQRRGLKSLGEEGVREFVAEYRDLAGDLARLQTAARGREREEVFYLSRLVASAHNLLYRGKALGLRDIWKTFAIDAPREVRRSIRPIALAALVFFGPAIIAYTAVVREPEVVRVFIPSGMLDRAEDGVRRARENEGYIEDPQLFRPVFATMIIANNVQVAFGAFAMGITFGLGTLLVLVVNGVSIGGVFGLYASKGIGTLLLAFVAPHGVLELTAICIAGGAGFLLGAAILVPGQRTRGEALRENGRRAIRLIAAATLLLLVAGALEGFVSPIPWWPLEGKLAVSGLTAVFLYIYLRSASGRREPPAEPAAALDETEMLGLTSTAR